MKWNPTTTVIPRVDESKLTYPNDKLTEPKRPILKSVNTRPSPARKSVGPVAQHGQVADNATPKSTRLIIVGSRTNRRRVDRVQISPGPPTIRSYSVTPISWNAASNV